MEKTHGIWILNVQLWRRETLIKKLANEKNRQQDLLLYENIEEPAPKMIADKRHIPSKVSNNTDFYFFSRH